MAESLLVRKGGGGGYPVLGIERNLVIQTGTAPIKKGDLLESNIIGFTEETPLYSTSQTYTSNVYTRDNNFAKIDERRVIHATVNQSGHLVLWLIKRDKNNALTTTSVFTSTTPARTISGENIQALYLSAGVFIVATVSSGTKRLQAFRLNENDTITSGTENTFAANAGNGALGKVSKNTFLVGYDLFTSNRNTPQVRYGEVNLSTLAITVQTNVQLFGDNQYFFGNIFGSTIDEQLQNGTSTTSSKTYTFNTFIYPYGPNTFTPFLANIYLTLTSTNTYSSMFIQNFASITTTFSNFDKRDNLEFTYTHQDYGLFVASGHTNSNTIGITRFTTSGGQQLETNVGMQSAKFYNIGKSVLAMIGTNTSSQLVYRLYNTRSDFGDTQLLERGENVTMFTSSSNNVTHGMVGFEDGTFIFSRLHYGVSGVFALRYKVITPIVRVNKLENPVRKHNVRYGVALADGTAGQTIKVLVF